MSRTSASIIAAHFAYTFTDEALLETALTHRSAGGRNNERLEFLGDAILNFVVADALYQRFPDASEGELTRLRARFVRGETLAEVAREIKLGELLRLGGGELKSGGRDRTSILADAFESIIGALYLDGGIEAARAAVLGVLEPRIRGVSLSEGLKDPKTRLQECLQSRKLPLPEYRVVDDPEGSARRFTVECHVEGLEETTCGDGESRRKAEQQAARKALDRLAEEGICI